MPRNKSPRASPPLSPAINRDHVKNKILLSLPPREYDAIIPKLKFMPLSSHTVLNEIERPIEFGYFMNDGLASVLNVMTDGKSTEVGLTGPEGFVGIPLVAGFKSSPTTVVIQIEGSGFRISASDFRETISKCPSLTQALHRFVQDLTMQAQQVAACNRVHEMEERLARWLLMCQDRVGSQFGLTQEFLGHMLASRRASVTVAAGILQKAGLIAYTRGHVQIIDRKMLEEASCECYGLLVRQSERWRAEVAGSNGISALDH